MERRLVCTVVFVSGICLYEKSWQVWMALLVILLLFAIWKSSLRSKSAWFFIAVCLGCGWLRACFDDVLDKRTDWLPRQSLEIEGQILEPPRTWGNSKAFLFRVDRANSQVSEEKLMVSWRGCTENLEPGDRWVFQGRFEKGKAPDYPAGFDQRFWLWTQRAEGVLKLGQFSQAHYLGPAEGLGPRQLSFRLRSGMLRRLNSIRSEEARSLVAGVVFGETQSLSAELQEHFRRTGTSHLLAASGMNVALLTSIVLLGARGLGFGAWRVVPLIVPLVVGYTFLAGCAPSIVRAAVGCLVTLSALWIGRRSDPWNSLALSVWGLLLWEPRMVYDLGFQLSVLAVVGLLAGPKLAKDAHWALKSLVLTLSASLLTLPLFWFSFQELSSTLLLANLVMGPVVELLFPLGLLLTLLPWRPLAYLCEFSAQISLYLAEFFSALASPIELAAPNVAVSVSVTVALFLWLHSRFSGRHLLALGLVGCSILLSSWSAAFPQVRIGELRVRIVGKVDEQPMIWLSSHKSEMLILSGEWQRRRALKLMRKLGSSRPARVMMLDDAPLNIRWGAFEWQKVRPTLPKSTFLELTTSGSTYHLSTWSPKNERPDSSEKHSLGGTHQEF